MVVEFVGGPFDGKRLEIQDDKEDYQITSLESSGDVQKYVYRRQMLNGLPRRLPDGTQLMCYESE